MVLLRTKGLGQSLWELDWLGLSHWGLGPRYRGVFRKRFTGCQNWLPVMAVLTLSLFSISVQEETAYLPSSSKTNHCIQFKRDGNTCTTIQTVPHCWPTEVYKSGIRYCATASLVYPFQEIYTKYTLRHVLIVCCRLFLTVYAVHCLYSSLFMLLFTSVAHTRLILLRATLI